MTTDFIKLTDQNNKSIAIRISKIDGYADSDISRAKTRIVSNIGAEFDYVQESVDEIYELIKNNQ